MSESRRILLVDDDPDIRYAFHRLLISAGYQVFLASDGEMALDKLAEVGHVDLMIADIVMPGINGLQLAKLVRDRDPSIGVLIISGRPLEVFRDAMPAGLEVGFLLKPFGPREFLDQVEASLEQGNLPG